MMTDPDIYGDSYEIAAALRRIAKSVESSDVYWLMEAAISIEGLYDALVDASKEPEGNIIATDKEYPAYGCHVDLFEIKDMKPDECVIDLGRPQDCIYAKGRTDKTTCEYWKPCSYPMKK